MAEKGHGHVVVPRKASTIILLRDHNPGGFAVFLLPDQAVQILGETGSAEDNLAYWIAGISEPFEEAGILLACDRTGRPLTLKTLQDLSGFDTIHDVFAAMPQEKISPVLPVLLTYQADEVLIFPREPDYSRRKAGEPADHADHGLPSSPSDNTTRLVLTDGRWVPHCKRPT